MDPLSDVLRVVRLDGAYFYPVAATEPWAVEAIPARELMPRVLPESDHLISYHVLVEGRCWGGLVGADPARLEAGDVLVFPHGDRHGLASTPGLRPVEIVEETRPRYPFLTTFGPPGPVRARFVCGFLGCDSRPFNPLLAALPHMLHVRGADNGWLAATARRVVEESASPRSGGLLVITRLSEMMFLEVVRDYLASLPSDAASWLSGLRDPTVGRALALLHERPEKAWSLQGLAEECGVSRSVLAERFTHFVGQPPMAYLARWRMQLAASLLSRGGAKIAAVADEVGYASEAAFSRAFKKETGVPPAAWRKTRARSA